MSFESILQTQVNAFLPHWLKCKIFIFDEDSILIGVVFPHSLLKIKITDASYYTDVIPFYGKDHHCSWCWSRANRTTDFFDEILERFCTELLPKVFTIELSYKGAQDIIGGYVA